MYPFLTVDAVGEYDVDCGVIGGGTTGQYDKSNSGQHLSHTVLDNSL